MPLVGIIVLTINSAIGRREQEPTLILMRLLFTTILLAPTIHNMRDILIHFLKWGAHTTLCFITRMIK